MPHRGANTLVGGDANVAGGYGTARHGPRGAGGDIGSSDSYPYTTLTDTEIEAKSSNLDDEDSKEAVRGKGRYQPADHVGQKVYHPNSFASSQNIMASIEASDVLEHLVTELGASINKASPSNIANGAGVIKTGPKKGIGSKAGWFSAPSPKLSDPETPAYTLRDIADTESDAEDHADIIKNRIHSQNFTVKEGHALLNKYIKVIFNEVF